MKYAKLENSERLQRVNNLLSDGKPHTTRDIIRKAHVCAVNSIIGELRLNGIEIQCQQKGRKWYYWKPAKQTKPVKQTLSPWFKDENPVRKGVYEVEGGFVAYWLGNQWTWYISIEYIVCLQKYIDDSFYRHDQLTWRGIVK